MIYGFEKNKFYIEYHSCQREVKSLKEECTIRAENLYRENNKIVLCLSSGLDSQIALVSFLKKDIPITCAFMYMPGYNDNEFDNLKILEKKHGFKTVIIEIDPIKLEQECIQLANEFDANPHHLLHYFFLKQLPRDHDVIQVAHDPWIMTTKTNEHYLINSFYDPEISRQHVLSSMSRQGKFKLFGDSNELFLSCIEDEIFTYFLNCSNYFSNKNIRQVHRYDYYIKPLLYSKHWQDELVYFPKFAGWENIPWLQKFIKYDNKKICFVKWTEVISILKTPFKISKRFYEKSLEEFNLTFHN